MGLKKRIFQKFQAASSKYRFLKDSFDPFTNAGKLESFEGKSGAEVFDLASDES